MNDQQLDLLIDSWLKDSDCPPSDIGRSTAQIESRLPQMPQRSRWWPLPSLERLTAPVAGSSPAGGSSMFSAVKFTAAAAIVALFSGVLLAGVLTTPQSDEVTPAGALASPAATAASEAISRDAAIFDGSITRSEQTGFAEYAADDGTLLSEGEQWLMELATDDPRLSGTFQIVWNMATHDNVFNVVTARGRIDNEHGSWIGTERGYDHPAHGWQWQGQYGGQGAYEGLTTLLFWQGDDVHGIVFPGEMPEALDVPDAAN